MDERSDNCLAQSGGEGITQRLGQDARADRQHDAQSEQHRVPSTAFTNGARHDSAQVLRTDQYFASSSRIRPVPRTTQVSGSSSTWIGSPVSWLNSRSSPRMS